MTRRQLAATAALGVILGALVLSPVMTAPNTRLPGVYESEQASTAWLFYRAQKTMVEEHDFPVIVRGTAYEDGGRIYSLCLLNVVLTLPLYPFLGAIGIHSASMALNVALAFFFAMLLLRRLSGDWWAALPGALLFSLSPYMVSHIIYGPPESSTYAWIVPAVIAAERVAARERFDAWGAAAVGIAVALCFSNSPYSGVFAAAVVAFSILTRKISAGPLWLKGVHGGLALAVAAVCIAPMAAAIRYTLVHPQTMIPGRSDRISVGQHVELLDDWAVQDVANFLLPTNAFHSRIYQEEMYLGLLALILTVVAVIRVRAARRWGWLALGGLIFCLGGTLQVAGSAPELFGGPIRMPAGLICRLPLLDSISHPYRFAPVVLLAMGAAIALWLARRGTDRPTHPWIALVVSALIVIDLGMHYPEGPFHVPTLEIETPRFYEQLAEDPDDYAVLDVPVAAAARTIGPYHLYQLTHDKFVPYNLRDVNLYDLPSANQLAQALTLPTEHLYGRDMRHISFECELGGCAGVEELAGAGYRYLVLHATGNTYTDRKLTECVERCLPEPQHADDQVRAYRLDRRAGALPAAAR